MESVSKAKITGLKLENVKRIKLVEIQPAENGLTIIGGNNGEGKTSVLDGIAYALGGESFRPSALTNGDGNAYIRVDIGDYTVEILSARKSTDYEGKDAIVIRYSFTNNSDDATSFMFATQSKAFQDGVELEMAVLMDDDTYNSQDLTKEIKTGASIEVEKAFVLDSDSPVEAEVSELVSFDDEQKVEKTFDLATL